MGAIAVDFDGVLHAYSRGWQDGSIYDAPVPEAFDALRALMERWPVFVHTSRTPGPVAEWIERHAGIPTVLDDDRQLQFWNGRDHLLITDRKFPALAYIDDRGIRFTSWSRALADLDAILGGGG